MFENKPELLLKWHRFMYNCHHIKLYYYGNSKHEIKMEKHKIKIETLTNELNISQEKEEYTTTKRFPFNRKKTIEKGEPAEE